jgi:hypothetical protein
MVYVINVLIIVWNVQMKINVLYVMMDIN